MTAAQALDSKFLSFERAALSLPPRPLSSPSPGPSLSPPLSLSWGSAAAFYAQETNEEDDRRTSISGRKVEL